MQLALKKYKLELRHTFSISRESHDFQDTLIVALTEKGCTGYGESTSNPYYNITLDSLEREIRTIEEAICNHAFTDPSSFYAFLAERELSNFARCALDLAAQDLYGKLLEKPLYEIWGTSIKNYPKTNYTIGLDTVEKMVAKMKERPWPIYKIKLGTEDDVAIIRELRLHTQALFRVDANCAWDAKTTLSNALHLKGLGVEFLEQPLKADAWDGMKGVIKQCALPVIADESCIVQEDVERCAGYFSGINIKLTKCGGLTPALAMIKKARELDLRVMVGCMTESTVGISAIAQLLPQLDYVDMDGAMLLKRDIATGVVIKDDAEIIFPDTGGSGIALLP